MSALVLHPDRHLPADPTTRAIARELYATTASLPVISPHGHVDPGQFVHDEAFADPTSLLISPDHYVTRLLHARGVELTTLGVGASLDEPGARRAWAALCAAWEDLAGTAVRTWLEAELVDLFGVEATPSTATADATFDQIAAALARPELRPRALYERFGVSVLATTDDPCSDLADHRALAADPTWTGRVIPTFRPDRYLEPAGPDWPQLVAQLGEVADQDTTTYSGYVSALESRRRTFIEHGATSADHSHADVHCDPLDDHEAERLFAAALGGRATDAECVAFRRHMLGEMARMSCEDGLVMTLHPGVVRNHHGPTHRRFGPDTGHDLPRPITFVEPLRPMLKRFGTHPGFHLVCFTIDSTTWSRDLVPLAGFYPSVHVGVPWWFLDAPDSLARFWDTVVDGIGFTRTSGFVDDTRALCSIPARHDLARRVEASALARLVATHRIGIDEAHRLAVRLVTEQPTKVFKL